MDGLRVRIDEFPMRVQLYLHPIEEIAFWMEASEDDLVAVDERESIERNRLPVQGPSSLV